ncbi:MAG: four helix bundle protein [Myxococcales bacterium]|nr:four helix bundle protein [Myxococcales bacterium]
MNVFDHEKLDVYRVAIDFVAIADGIVEGLPRGRGYLADQLLRAATSIVLNIAEGAGEHSTSEKARFYRMARRSATECAAVLDVCRKLGLGSAEQLSEGRDRLVRIVSMLTRLGRSLESSGARRSG